MIIYGIDFTSAPKRQKPITCAKCLLVDELLRVQDVECFTSFVQFEYFLQTNGPWITGLDFPFGQPRKLIENLSWPLTWEGYVKLVGNMDKLGYEQLLKKYQQNRPYKDKRHFRLIDRKADSRSPMQLDFVPVGKMFCQGAPRLLKSGASILPNHPTDSNKLIVEAYPALVARKIIGSQSYKNDTKSKQTAEQRDARIRIIKGISSDKLEEIFGFCTRLSDEQIKLCIEEPSADLLDSVLCAIQATWAYTQKNNHYGIPVECDPLEGWIVDPAMEQTESLFPFFRDSANE